MGQCVVMKFLVNEAVKPADIYRRLQTQYGDKTLSSSKTFEWCKRRPVFMHGPQGPGPRAANFQGRHIKKTEIEVWYAEKKGCPQERKLREIYTENNVSILETHYNVLSFVLFLLTRN
jgi:hypothetical protein